MSEQFETITNGELSAGFINKEVIDFEDRIRGLSDTDSEIIEFYKQLVELIF